MKLITIVDVIDTYIRIKQLEINSILSKIAISKIIRIKNSWNENKTISGFGHILFLMEHWNKIITGNSNINYPEYFCKNICLKIKIISYYRLVVERVFIKENLQNKDVFLKLLA